MTNEIMIGYTIWQKNQNTTGFGSSGKRTLGRSWWRRNKPITVYQTESQCKRYLESDEIAVPVFVKIETEKDG